MVSAGFYNDPEFANVDSTENEFVPYRGRIMRTKSGKISSPVDREPCVSCTTFNILAPSYKRLDQHVISSSSSSPFVRFANLILSRVIMQQNPNIRESDFRAFWLGRNERILDWLLYESSSIICLQEFWVGNEELVHMFEDRLGAAGYETFKLARTNNRGDVNKNICVEQETIIVNTYLLFPHVSSLSVVRLHQVYQILFYLETYQKENKLTHMPVILCGKRGHVYKFLRSQGFVSSYDIAYEYTNSGYADKVNLTGLSYGLSFQDTKDLWVQADFDGNGVLDYEEFKRIWNCTWSEDLDDDCSSDDSNEGNEEEAIGFAVKNAALFPREVEKGIWPENYSLSDHARLTALFSPFLIASAIDDYLRSCPSFRSHKTYRGRARQSGVKETRLRVCSLNIGTLNSRLLELTDVLSNRKIDFACIQETRWKGARARECNGYKLWYSGIDNARNGVGILVSSRLKENIVEVCRYRDRIMMIKLDDVLRSIPEDQRFFIGGDFNGHIGNATNRYDSVHGGFGFGSWNEKGRMLLEFATAHDMVVTNSFFNKRDVNLITFHSGGHCTQIDYIQVRNRDRWACIDCKVFPEEVCASQHILLVLVFHVRHGRSTNRRAKLGKPRILWKNLHGATTDDFRNKGRSRSIKNRGGGTTKSKLRYSTVDGSTDHHTTTNDCPTREEGVKWLTNIFNIILDTAKMPEEWRESTVIPICKNKGDPQRCGNYRGIKILSHTMKLWERVIEARLRQVTKVSENQFGFMPYMSTTEAIHLLRRLMEKYREKIEIFTWRSFTLRRCMIVFPAIRSGRPWKRDGSQLLISGRFVICTIDLLHTSGLQLATPRHSRWKSDSTRGRLLALTSLP
ncbi:Detected protein of unknown function [Hibiscus syriacus]|uniref:EF-hand domain-containing protein n=1 Tax=Hibiscus syriacus TaxID=106335 RepID=A0A6A3A420_HIBSY|nr:Detected protein of unknown function [Hibiscus syriacus]